MALRWYVVHAYSNFEHRVAEGLKERIKRAGLEPKFGEILVPTEEVVEMRDGQKRKSERKFYPGYVLVQMEMDENTWHLVHEVPKVLGFIGGLITVWVNLNSRLTLLEARLGFGDEKFNAIDKKFDEVMMHLRRIEDKLDNKADR